MTTLEELKYNRNASLVVLFTLGLGALFITSIRPVWLNNMFEGTLLDNGVIGFVMKIFSSILVALLIAAIMFIIHFFKLIYYQIEISRKE